MNILLLFLMIMIFSFLLYLSFVSLSMKSLTGVVNDFVNIEISNRLDDYTKVRFTSLDFNAAFSILTLLFAFHNRAFAIDSRSLNCFFIRYQTFLACLKTFTVSLLTFVANTKNNLFDDLIFFDNNVLFLDD